MKYELPVVCGDKSRSIVFETPDEVTGNEFVNLLEALLPACRVAAMRDLCAMPYWNWPHVKTDDEYKPDYVLERSDEGDLVFAERYEELEL